MKGIHDRYNYHLDIIISNYEFIKANLIKKERHQFNYEMVSFNDNYILIIEKR